MTRLSAICCTLAVGAVFATDPPVAKPPAATDAKPAKDEKKRPTTPEEFAELAKQYETPPYIPVPRRTTIVDQRIDGTVLSVSDDAIEIKLKGKNESVKYPAHPVLVSGAICHWETDSRSYLLDDVKVRDVVVLSVCTVDQEKGPECYWVSIRWRPGGVIPPCCVPSKYDPYHERRQREVEYEIKGEYTPEELKRHEEHKVLNAKQGLAPLKPLPPRKPLEEERMTPKK
jgi:hypothetical protein